MDNNLFEEKTIKTDIINENENDLSDEQEDKEIVQICPGIIEYHRNDHEDENDHFSGGHDCVNDSEFHPKENT